MIIDRSSPKKGLAESEAESASKGDEDRIVLYYPKGGNTRRLDKAIAEEIGSVGGVVAVVRCYVGDLCCSSLKQKSNH